MGFTIIASPRSFRATHAGKVLRRLRHATRTRAELAADLGLSPASVSRAVRALDDVGLISETDATQAAHVGRPELVLDLALERTVILGITIGMEETTLSVSNVRGDVLASSVAAETSGPDALADLAMELLIPFANRRLLAAGLIMPAGADLATTAAALTAALDLDVVAAERSLGVALAALVQEYPIRGRGVFLLSDAFDWHLLVLSMDGGEISAATTLALTHFPTQTGAPCGCGRTGCLGAAVPVPTASRPLGRDGAFILGDVVAHAHEMTRPDHLFLVGDAFCEEDAWAVLHSRARDLTAAASPRAVSLPGGTEAAAACAVALVPYYEDPVALATAGIDAVPRYRHPLSS